jgi:hypothetical protein
MERRPQVKTNARLMGDRMSDITQARTVLEKRILEGQGDAAAADRRAAFNDSGLGKPLATLVDKVARHAYRITDEDFATVLTSGLSEDQVFEIVVCAAIGQSSRQYGAALASLQAAIAKE